MGAEAAGTDADGAANHPAEVADVGKSGAVRHLCKRQPGLLQQRKGVLNPQFRQIVRRGHAHLLFEDAAQGGTVHRQFVGEAVDVEIRVGKMLPADADCLVDHPSLPGGIATICRQL